MLNIMTDMVLQDFLPPKYFLYTQTIKIQNPKPKPTSTNPQPSQSCFPAIQTSSK